MNEDVLEAGSRPILITQLKQMMATAVHMRKIQNYLQI